MNNNTHLNSRKTVKILIVLALLMIGSLQAQAALYGRKQRSDTCKPRK